MLYLFYTMNNYISFKLDLFVWWTYFNFIGIYEWLMLMLLLWHIIIIKLSLMFIAYCMLHQTIWSR